MGTDRISTSNHHSLTSKQLLTTKAPIMGVVSHVILDDSDSFMDEVDQETVSDKKNTTQIGWCYVQFEDTQLLDKDNQNPHPPYDVLNLDLPLQGEQVEMIPIGNIFYYKRITKGNLNVGNAISTFQLEKFNSGKSTSNNSASSYNKTSQTGITNSNINNSDDIKIGKYFEPTQTNRLKLYEGDKLIQSRFGQSIRFSGYNNSDNKFAPSIIIRNRQYDIAENDLKLEDMFEEDINRDGSIIALVSGEHKLTYQPGIIDDGGSSNFETKPKNFDKYPKELVGKDQILINSERLIFSSKSAEMIFYSKGNYGFISDGQFSIDNGKAGAKLDFNGDVRLTTNDFNTYILGNNGKVFLNTETETEHLVRGDTLVKLLEQVIDLLVAQVFPTPSGPSAVGPTNQGDLNKIKSQLKTILSTKNFTE